MGGETEAEGRVEICYSNGRWYTVCGRYWTDNNTAVVCRHLGFSDITGGELFTDISQLYIVYDTDSTQQSFGKGSGPILMDFVNCTGLEPRLWPSYRAPGCPHFTHYYGCSHNDDVGVKCQPGIIIAPLLVLCRAEEFMIDAFLHVAACSDGQLKLIGSSVRYYGRIEICSNQRWETLSYQQWTPSNALVACNELGFSGN